MSLWNDERVQQLRDLAAKGLTASQIMKELPFHVSRNSVIGKMHREDIQIKSGRNCNATRIRGRTTAPVKKDGGRACAPAVQTFADESRSASSLWPARTVPAERPTNDPLPFVEIAGGRRNCMFPLGGVDETTGPDMMCCGAPVITPGDYKSTRGTWCHCHFQRLAQSRREQDAQEKETASC